MVCSYNFQILLAEIKIKKLFTAIYKEKNTLAQQACYQEIIIITNKGKKIQQD